jgi:hypothetical protein
MNLVLTKPVMQRAALAGLTCHALAAQMNTTRWAVRLAEERTGIRLEPIVRRKGWAETPASSVSAHCRGCGLRWVPLVAGTRCSLCAGAG